MRVYEIAAAQGDDVSAFEQAIHAALGEDVTCTHSCAGETPGGQRLAEMEGGQGGAIALRGRVDDAGIEPSRGYGVTSAT